MAVSENLKNAVAEKNIVAIRDSLFGIMAVDISLRTGGKFDESLKYCLANGISEAELFEADDAKEIPSEATKENMTKICSMMGENFSKEKLEAAKRMGKILYPDSAKSEEKKTSSQHRTRSEGSHTTESNSAGAGVVIAAVAAAVIIGIIVLCARR